MISVTNIELYEALRKDLSEDSARLIAEVVPPAADVATKADISDLRNELSSVELRLERRISALERRFFAVFAVPLWGATVAAVTKYVLEI